MKKRTLNEYRQTKEYYTHKETKKEDKFVEDLVQSRFEAAIKEVYEWTIDDLYENIQEAMGDHDLIPFDEGGDINWEKLDNDFHKIYIGVILELIKDQIMKYE
jgi:hypothetical protein